MLGAWWHLCSLFCNAKQHRLLIILSSDRINFVNLCLHLFKLSILDLFSYSHVRTVNAPENTMQFFWQYNGLILRWSIQSSMWWKAFHLLLQNMFLVFNFLFLCLFPSRDLLRIGVTLAGHQKKILSNIQSMRVQMSQSPITMAWLQGALCHGTGSIRRTNNNGSPRMTPDPSERARVETIVLI